MRTVENIVKQEVIYCVSYLVSELAGEGRENAMELCYPVIEELEDGEEYEREILEHWIVSDWLASELEELGERVDHDFHGLTVWGRTTSGQGIDQDYVMQQVADRCNARYKQLVEAS